MQTLTLKNAEMEKLFYEMKNLSKIKLPFVLGLKVARITKALEAAYDPYKETIQEIFKTLGVQNQENGGYDIPKENQKQFQAEVEAVAKKTVEIAFPPIEQDELDAQKKVEETDTSRAIEVGTLSCLVSFIKE